MCSCPGGCEGGPECLDDEGGPLPAEVSRKPFAVCAPGMGVLVRIALVLDGDTSTEVRETPLLEGGEAYIVTPPDFGKLLPPLVITPEPPGSSALRARGLARTFAQPPVPFAFGSVA